MTTVAEGAIVCKDAKLLGTVTVGAGTIIHPSAIVNGEVNYGLVAHCHFEPSTLCDGEFL